MSGTGGVGRAHAQWRAYVKKSVRGSRRANAILQEMAAAGWSEEVAQQMIRETASKERWKAIGAMVGCAALGIVATAFTITSYEAASVAGGEYWICYGGIVCGVVGFFWGLVRLAKIRA